MHAQTAAGRRAREPRWHPRKIVRSVFGHRLADIGLPPPLKVTFGQDAKPRKAGRDANSGGETSLEQQLEAEEASAKVKALSAAADQLEGFSGREISKLMIALQSVRETI